MRIILLTSLRLFLATTVHAFVCVPVTRDTSTIGLETRIGIPAERRKASDESPLLPFPRVVSRSYQTAHRLAKPGKETDDDATTGVRLDSVVPWGRSLSEYRGMFDLTNADLLDGALILDVGGGPASFNAEATGLGANVVSVDPIYFFGATQIERRIDETYDIMIREVKRNDCQFNWNDDISSAEDMGAARRESMNRFLADYRDGKKDGRYVIGGLPELPFEDSRFDLALSGNFLFLYSDRLTTDFHLRSVREMCRVAREARVFPLHDLANRPSEHLAPVVTELRKQGYCVERLRVPYEMLHGSIYMLKVSR